MIPQIASADTNVTIGRLTYELDEAYHKATVRGLSSNNVTELIIPDKVAYNGADFSVTSISGRAFDGCSGLTAVTIPNSVTSIGAEARKIAVK